MESVEENGNNVSSLRVSVAAKFGSQVLPPSSENDLRLLSFRLE
jgi:hypothetical protein